MTAAAGKFALIPVSALKPLTGVPSRCVRLYFALRLRYRPGHATWPADKALSEALGIKLAYLWRDLGDLRDGGLLQIQAHKVDGRRNTYTFQHSGLSAKVPETVVWTSGISGNQLIAYAALRNAVHWARTPTLDTIAGRYGIPPRTLKRALAGLEGLGLVTTSKVATGGRSWRNTYEFPNIEVPICKSISAGGTHGLAPRNPTDWHSVVPQIGTSLIEGETVYEETGNEETGTATAVGQPAAVVKDILSGEHKSSRASTVGKHPFIEAEFDKWLATFPRRQNQTHNRRAVEAEYRLALEKVGAGVLQATAKLYAAKGVDPQFVPLAQNWLKRECWADFHRPPREPTEWERARQREFLVSMERQEVREEAYARHCGQEKPREDSGRKEWETGCYAWLGTFTKEQAAEAEAEAIRRARKHPRWK